MHEQPTALVIDDSPSSCLLLSALLRQLGLKVLTARDGETGLALVREHRPAMVCLDLMLPTISGLAVYQQLRRDPATARIPVVMVSGRPFPKGEVADDHLGPIAHLGKPVDPKQFSDTVRSMLQVHRDTEGS